MENLGCPCISGLQAGLCTLLDALKGPNPRTSVATFTKGIPEAILHDPPFSGR